MIGLELVECFKPALHRAWGLGTLLNDYVDNVASLNPAHSTQLHSGSWLVNVPLHSLETVVPVGLCSLISSSFVLCNVVFPEYRGEHTRGANSVSKPDMCFQTPPKNRATAVS